MNTRLAGNNILILESSQKEASRICSGFKSLGANVFTAQDQVKSQTLQKRWDIDIIVCDISFLTGLGEVVAQDTRGGIGKNSPLLFVYGPASLIHPKTFEAKGVLKYFSGVLDPALAAPVISGYLYDAKKHCQQLVESSVARVISFILQNGVDTFVLEVSDFSDDGLTAPLDGTIVAETGSLTVVVPEGSSQRFAVRLERKTGENDTIRLKMLWRDRERWVALLKMVDNRQKQIIDFLTASSGK